VRPDERSIRIGLLAPEHDRAKFSCGNDPLDRYIREQATQDVRRGLARVHVASHIERPTLIVGYYTLSAASVAAVDLPPETAKRLPRYPIPAALVGRLAVDQRFARQGIGTVLLADAVKKAAAAAETVAITVVIVDPIDEAAASFYTAFGFRNLQGPQRRMFLALARG
jgi:GNAT superfamily N-acetyltransferase